MRIFHQQKRGASLLEAMLIIPILLTLIMMAIEVGNMLGVRGRLDAATQSSVRIAAQRGGTGFTNGTGHGDIARFFAEAAQASGFNDGYMPTIVVADTGPSLCRANSPNRNVTLKTQLRYQPITPFGNLLGMLGAAPPAGTSGGPALVFTSFSVARCEVTW